MWRMDVVGSIEPKGNNGDRFILLGIEYFINWVEAVSSSKVTKEIITIFVMNDIIYRYGQPEVTLW